MYILRTFTKSEYEITDEQEQHLRRTGMEGTITLNGNTIKASNIAEIVKVHKQRDDRTLEAPKVVYNKERYVRALENIIRGLRQSGKNPRLLAHMEQTLERARNAVDSAKFGNPLSTATRMF